MWIRWGNVCAPRAGERERERGDTYVAEGGGGFLQLGSALHHLGSKLRGAVGDLRVLLLRLSRVMKTS